MLLITVAKILAVVYAAYAGWRCFRENNFAALRRAGNLLIAVGVAAFLYVLLLVQSGWWHAALNGMDMISVGLFVRWLAWSVRRLTKFAVKSHDGKTKACSVPEKRKEGD